ncbi:MAG: hypothetical protein OEV59_02300 [Deltaproteobacteria bacterium]|nr:hypothetical protein [Deltaproteobacteria bacterium]
MRVRVLFLIIGLVFCLGNISNASSDFDIYVQKYISDLEKEKAVVFMTRCGGESSTGKPYMATLIFRVDKKGGLLTEMLDGSVSNLADVVIDESGVKLTETHGGVWSYERTNKIVKEGLLKYGFHIFAPMTVDIFANYMPSNKCSFR